MRVIKGLFALYAGLFVLMTGIITVRAEPVDVRYTESVIDRSRTCSVTIHEYVSNNGDAAALIDGNAVGAEGLLPNGAVPVCDVGFCCVKIAEPYFTPVGKAGDICTARFKGISPQLADLMAELRVRSSHDFDNCYDIDEITDLINAANAVSTASVASFTSKYGTRLPDTDEEGITKALGLTQGLYLFAETETPAGCVPCDPFCIALPQTNISEMNIDNTKYDPGEIWLYDISVYPKSRSVSVQKAIVVAEKNEKGEIVGETYESSATACIGDTLKFAITADVPKLSDDTRNRLYVIEDVMGPGLIYKGDIRLSVGASADTADLLTPNSDYKIDTSSEHATIRIIFTKKGLARLGETEQESHVYVNYSAYLDKNAYVADPGNINSATLHYGTDHSHDIEAFSRPVTVFTYMLTLKKTFSPAQDHFGDVRFSLSNGKEKLYFIRESDGVYHTACEDEENDQTALVSPNDSTGVLIMKGLANGTYNLIEEETIQDYSLLGESIEISIKNRNLSVDIENKKSIDLVHTGGKGLVTIICSASVMIAVGLLIILRALRSQRSGHEESEKGAGF